MRLSLPSPPGEARTVRGGAVKFLLREAEAGERGSSGGQPTWLSCPEPQTPHACCCRQLWLWHSPCSCQCCL